MISENRSITRRSLAGATLWTAAGAVLGASARSFFGVRRPGPPAEKASPPPIVALSARALQASIRRARSAGAPVPPLDRDLHGLNRIEGFTVLDDGDVVLFGRRDSAGAPIHIDDLMVALRSAYGADGEAPGCSIDPRDDHADPWSIQRVRILGMPLDCLMARRHVAVDYELKLAGAGLLVLGDGVAGAFDRSRDGRSICSAAASEPLSVSHRFWFCALYPQETRFEQQDATTLIRHPVNVQVLTERRLHDRAGVKGAEPDAAADRFAHGVTNLLAQAGRKAYQEVRNDFRVIELARLMAYQNVPRERFAYLLEEHIHEQVEVPRYVTGVRRTERSEVTCGGEVDDSGDGLRASSRVVRAQRDYRGGVEARIEISREHVARSATGSLGLLAKRIAASRPSAAAVTWEIAEG
jgi:hypothetical protein